jgi:hypothetical protein
MNSDTACSHDWQPIPNWYARYRCSTCHVIGVKLMAVAPREAGIRRTEIQPYRCGAQSRGQRCGAPAVYSGYGTKFRCAEHGHGAPAGRARRATQAGKPAAAPVADASEETATSATESAPTPTPIPGQP